MKKEGKNCIWETDRHPDRQTDRHPDGNGDSKTEAIQWADSVKK